MDGVKFYGIIDRVDKNSDGTYTIYDYKTGNAKQTEMYVQTANMKIIIIK